MGICVSSSEDAVKRPKQRPHKPTTRRREPSKAVAENGLVEVKPERTEDRSGAVRRADSDDEFVLAPVVLCGLDNLGNTCYCNAVIQMLFACELLRNHLDDLYSTTLSPKRIKNFVVPEPPGSLNVSVTEPSSPSAAGNQGKPPLAPRTEPCDTLLFRTCELFAYLYDRQKCGPYHLPLKQQHHPQGPTSNSPFSSQAGRPADMPLVTGGVKPRPNTLSPSAFLKCLRQRSASSVFRSHGQQDAHEFALFMIHALIEDERYLFGIEPKQTTPIERLFSGWRETQTTCMCCDSTSSRKERMMDLNVDIMTLSPQEEEETAAALSARLHSARRMTMTSESARLNRTPAHRDDTTPPHGANQLHPSSPDDATPVKQTIAAGSGLRAPPSSAVRSVEAGDALSPASGPPHPNAVVPPPPKTRPIPLSAEEPLMRHPKNTNGQENGLVTNASLTNHALMASHNKAPLNDFRNSFAASPLLRANTMSTTQNSSLRWWIERMSCPDYLLGENRFRCDACSTNSDARRCTKIQQGPPVLMVQLKRFRYSGSGNGMVKMNTTVPFGEALYIEEEVMVTVPSAFKGNATAASGSGTSMKVKRRVEAVYDLISVVVHQGGTPFHGHYFAMSRWPQLECPLSRSERDKLKRQEQALIQQRLAQQQLPPLPPPSGMTPPVSGAGSTPPSGPVPVISGRPTTAGTQPPESNWSAASGGAYGAHVNEDVASDFGGSRHGHDDDDPELDEDEPPTWNLCNDNITAQITFADVHRFFGPNPEGNAYLLLFVRRDMTT